MKNEINAPNIVSIGNVISWGEWLKKIDAKLKELGYFKVGKIPATLPCFTYVKNFDEYSIHIEFHDYRKTKNGISRNFTCYVNKTNMSMCVNSFCKETSLLKFEKIAVSFVTFNHLNQ